MTTLPGTKFKLPVGKVFALIAKLVGFLKGGVTHEESVELLEDFMSLFSTVLNANLPH